MNMKLGSFTVDELIATAKKLLRDIPFIADVTEQNSIRQRLTTLKEELGQRTSDLERSSLYADVYQDPFFVRMEDIKSAQSMNQDLCASQSAEEQQEHQRPFSLTHNQTFLKSFMSPSAPYNSLVLFHGTGTGKCHGIDTPIQMYDGTIRMVQDVGAGDEVMGDDGTPRRVLSLARGVGELYNISCDLGAEFTANADHILCLRAAECNNVEHMSVADYIALDGTTRRQYRMYKQPTEFSTPTPQFQVPPYLLALGACSFVAGAFRITEPEVVHHVHQICYEAGWPCKYHAPLLRIAHPLFEQRGASDWFVDQLSASWRSNVHDRLDMMAAFIDSCGYHHNNTFVAMLTDESSKIVQLFESIANSLGCFVNVRREAKPFVEMCIYNASFPLRTSRKVPATLMRSVSESQFRVESIGVQPYFGFMVDGNHRYLLGNNIVTHNSCTALTIAEQFKTHFSSRVLVLLPSALKDQYRKQIFDINKVDFVVANQCIASNYLSQIKHPELMSKKRLNDRVQKLVSDTYEFFGFIEFANLITRIEASIARSETRGPEYVSEQVNRRLRDIFSNRVIIIDEVHNIRADGSETSKIVPPILLRVLRVCDNIKLILCTATPMYNEASEIVWLLNLVMANEKRPYIDPGKIFSRDGGLRDSSAFARLCRGYVSVVDSSQNKDAFPTRLFPHEAMRHAELPTQDINGNAIPKTKRLNTTPLLCSRMSDHQTLLYQQALRKTTKNYNVATSNDQEISSLDSVPDPEGEGSSFALLKALQLGNMVYPVTGTWGKEAFKECFSMNAQRNKSPMFLYKDNMVAKHGAFLSRDYLSKYSCKMSSILNTILQSEGVLFIHSYFLYSGIIPLAITLEHAGFSRWGGPNLIHAQQHANKYCILTRDTDFASDFNKILAEVKAEDNVGGGRIKVILGTNVVAEGVDFKFIRQVHIMEPWFHLNKLEQVIGRAARTCSHHALPPEKRNVMIYYHVAVPADYATHRRESVDLRLYRIAESKQKHIAEVETLLRQNAIDCSVRQRQRGPKVLSLEKEGKTTLIDAQGRKHSHSHSRNEEDVAKCAVQARPMTDAEATLVAEATPLYSHAIKMSFEKNTKQTFQDIEKFVKKGIPTYSQRLLAWSLHDIIANPTERFVIQYRGHTYHKVPMERAPAPAATVVLTPEHFATEPVRALESFSTFYHATCTKSFGAPSAVPEALKDVLLEYAFDRLPKDTLIALLREVLAARRAGTLSDKTLLLLECAQSAGVLVEFGGRTYVRTPYDSTLHIVRDASNNSSELGEATVTEMNDFYAISQKTSSSPFTKDLLGYLHVRADKEAHFKIVKKEHRSQGYICSQTSTSSGGCSAAELVDLIGAQLQITLTKQTKVFLCNIYELVLRYVQKRDDNQKRVFGRPMHLAQ